MTPKEMVMKSIANNNNPMLKNLLEMAQQGNSKGIEDFARNLYKEKGRDFDKEFSAFMSQYNKGYQ